MALELVTQVDQEPFRVIVNKGDSDCSARGDYKNMATNQQVRQMVTAQPFRSFRIKLAGGRAFIVKHPENVACSLNGREMTVYDDDGVHLVETLLIEVIEPAATGAAESGGDGGAR
jgi:hypothetical protein